MNEVDSICMIDIIINMYIYLDTQVPWVKKKKKRLKLCFDFPHIVTKKDKHKFRKENKNDRDKIKGKGKEIVKREKKELGGI